MAQIPQISDELLLRAFSRPSLGQTIQAGTEGFGKGVDIGSKLAEQKARRKKEEQDLLQQIEQLKLQQKQQALKEKESAAGMIPMKSKKTTAVVSGEEVPVKPYETSRDVTPEVYKALNPAEKTPDQGQSDFIKTTFTTPDGRAFAVHGRPGKEGEVKVSEIPISGTPRPFVAPLLPAEQAEKTATFGTLSDIMGRIGKQKKDEYIGPIDYRMKKAQLYTNAEDPEFAKFSNNIEDLSNQIVYLRSGKQINEAEFQRLKRAMPNPTRKEKSFQAQWEEFNTTFNDIRARREEEFRRTGYYVPEESGKTFNQQTQKLETPTATSKVDREALKASIRAKLQGK
jgi:hypothetical protein